MLDFYEELAITDTSQWVKREALVTCNWFITRILIRGKNWHDL